MTDTIENYSEILAKNVCIEAFEAVFPPEQGKIFDDNDEEYLLKALGIYTELNPTGDIAQDDDDTWELHYRCVELINTIHAKLNLLYMRQSVPEPDIMKEFSMQTGADGETRFYDAECDEMKMEL